MIVDLCELEHVILVEQWLSCVNTRLCHLEKIYFGSREASIAGGAVQSRQGALRQ